MAMDAPVPDNSLLLPSGTMPVLVVGGAEIVEPPADEGAELPTVGAVVVVVGAEEVGTVDAGGKDACREGAHGSAFTSRTKDCLLLPGTRTATTNVCRTSG